MAQASSFQLAAASFTQDAVEADSTASVQVVLEDQGEAVLVERMVLMAPLAQQTQEAAEAAQARYQQAQTAQAELEEKVS